MRIICLLFLLTAFYTVSAQKIMTVDDAVNIALKNNFDILIARKSADIARNDNTPGNAGMLPSIRINGSENYELNNTNQKLASGNVNKYPSLSSNSLNLGTELSWTLFDGGKMFVTKSKLNEIEALGEIEFKDKILQTVYNVISTYYNVIRQKQELNSINEVINYNQERVKIAQTGFSSGSLAKTELLQAKIDLNVYRENAINQQLSIVVAKKALNVLLGQNADASFEVTDTIPLQYSLDKKELFQKIDQSNTDILATRKQMDIARLYLEECSRLFLPVVNFKAGYYLSKSVNSDGSVLKNQYSGPQAGGTVSIPLYTGGENRRKVSDARIQLQSAEYDLQNVKIEVTAELQNAIDGYENQIKLIQIEKENKELSRENFEICLHRLRLGQTTSLEVHQAQENYVQSCTRLIDFEYNLKIAETKLKQLIAAL